MADNPYLQLSEQDRSAAPTAAPAPTTNPYDVLATEDLENSKKQIKGVLDIVSPINPDKAAEALKLSRSSGLPEQTVQDNLSEVQRQERLRLLNMQRLMSDSPVLARQLLDPNFAKIAHDNVEHMGNIEMAASHLARSLGSGVLNLGAAGTKLLEAFNPFTTSEEDLAVLYKDNPQKLQEMRKESSATMLSRWSQEQTKLANQIMENAPAQVKAKYGSLQYFTTDTDNAAYLSPVKLIGDALNSLPTTMALMYSMYITKGAAGNAMANGATVMQATKIAAETMAKVSGLTEGLVGYAQQANQTRADVDKITDKELRTSPAYYDLVDKQGFSPEAARIYLSATTAEKAGTMAGLIDAVTNFYGGRFLGKIITEGGSLLPRMGKGFLTEALTEAPQSMGEQFAQNYAINDNMNRDQSLTENVAESGAAGFFVGGLTGGTFSGLLGGAQNKQQEAGKATQLFEMLNKLNDLAGADVVRQRDVQSFANFMQAVEDEQQGPVNTLYINPKTLIDTLTAAGVNIQQVIDTVPSLANLQEQAQNGTDIAIPVSDFATHIAGTDYAQALLPQLKSDPTGMTKVEADEYMQNHGEQLKAEVDRILSEHEGKTEFKSSMDKVKADIKTQLEETKRFRNDVNEAYSTLMSTFYAVTGAKLGMTPEQMAAKYPIKISAQSVNDGQQYDQAGQLMIETPNFKKWFKSSKVVDENGKAKVMYHGTAQDIHRFRAKQAGAIFVTEDPDFADNFTEMSKDWMVDHYEEILSKDQIDAAKTAAEKYIREEFSGDPDGADLLAHQMRMGDRLTNIKARFLFNRALAEQMPSGPNIMPVYVSAQNPFDYQNPEHIAAVVAELNKNSNQWGEPRGDKSKPFLESGNWEEIEKSTTQAAIKAAGFDGFYVKESGEKNLAVYDNTQIKSVFNNGGFDENSSNILYQRGKEQVAGKAVPETIDALSNVESAFEFAGTNEFPTNRDFKVALQDRINEAAKAAKIDLADFSKATEEYLVRIATADGITALRTNANAVGWYNEKVTKALRLVSLIHPEVSTDPQSKFAFVWAMAVTSNGLKVDKNFELAEQAYSLWKDSNEDITQRIMPKNVGIGTAAEAINRTLNLYNDLIQKYGFERVEEFMTTLQTAGEVEKFTGQKVSGENKTTMVYGAAALGPKIGNGFFMNLYGHFEQLTMDRWLMRTWGRWTGTLVDVNQAQVKAKRTQLKELIRSMSAADKKGFEAIIKRKLTLSEIDDVGVAIWKASQKPANRVLMTKVGIADEAGQAKFVEILGETKKGQDRVSFGDELRKSGNALTKYLDGQKEAPSGPPERGNIRKVFSQVLAKLQEDHPALTMSDYQALLWYPEKRLYDAAKTADEATDGYEDDEAPDYANAAAKLARAKGITDDAIAGAIAAVDDELQAADGATGVRSGSGRSGNSANDQGSQTLAQNPSGWENAETTDPSSPDRNDPRNINARGTITFGKDISETPSVITLFNAANLSTFLHESGHFFLEVNADIASRPDAPKEIVDDMQSILNWFGIQDIATWRGMDIEQKREYHERFARGFEAYLFEGKSPNTELQGVFQRFRSWVVNVYKQISGLNVELSPEIRGVFDRMLASSESIQQAEQARSFAPLFTSKPPFMTDDEWVAYQQTDVQQGQDAVSELETKSLRDMQWLTNAKARILKSMQKEHAELRKEVRREVENEVMAEPVYRAREFFKRGTLDGQPVDVPVKLSIPEIEAMYEGNPIIGAIKKALGFGKYGMMGTENGMHPAQAAEMFGFTSADHMIRTLLEAPDPRTVIEQRTDQTMMERYGDINSPEALSRAADEAIHNDARARFVTTEANALAKAVGKPRLVAAAAKQYAQQIINRLKIRNIRAGQYAASAARAGREAAKSKDLVEQATAKRNQVINTYAAKAAYEAQQEVIRGVRYLTKFDSKNISKAVHVDSLEQIWALLDRFDLRTSTTLRNIDRKNSLVQWVESQRAKGEEPIVPEELLNEAYRTSYKEMTLEDFRGLIDSIRNIEHLGRLKSKLIKIADQREFKAVSTEAGDVIRENATKDVEQGLEQKGLKNAIATNGREVFAWHRKFASLIRQMDGFKDGGFLWSTFVKPMNEAGTKEASMREQATVKLAELYKLLGNINLNKMEFIPEINNSLSMEGRLSIALNMGNEINMRRVMEGENWSAAQVYAIIGSLTREQWNFVQGTWDFLNSYWPEISAKERRLTGIVPEKVQARSFTIELQDGTTMAIEGGYYPIKYNASRSSKAEADTAADILKQMEQGLYARAQTARGHTKARVESVGRPMRYDLGVIDQHLNQVIHDLSWHEYLIDANRLIASNPVDLAIRDHYGPEVVKVMRKTLEDVAIGELSAQGTIERGVKYLRTGVSVASMGWNLITSLQQPLGLTQSMVRIGPKWVAMGLSRWLRDASSMESTVEWIGEKSEFMRLRAKTMQREIAEIRNTVNKGATMTAVEGSFFYLIGKMQLVADVPTWLGMYEKAMAGNETEERAIALADQAVLDSQGGGQIKDLSLVQRGGQWQQLFTNFYSFFNVTYNQLAESINETKKVGPSRLPLLAVDFLMLTFVPATLGFLLKAAAKGTLGDDDEDELLKKLAAENVGYLFGMMIGTREIGSAVAGTMGYQGPAGTRFFSSLGNLKNQISQGEADEAFWRSINDVGGILLHYPSLQIDRTVRGIMELTEDGENPLAIFFGPKPKN